MHPRYAFLFVEYTRMSSRHNPMSTAARDFSTPVCSSVCKRCYERNPDDLYLIQLICRSIEQHKDVQRVLVTQEYGTLVQIRPLPTTFRPPRFFRKCYDSSESCRFWPGCRFAHSEAEKRVWNKLLEKEMSATQTHHPRHSHPPVSNPQATATPRSTESYLNRQKNPPSPNDMFLPVNLENYRRKYKALLYYEEEEHVEVLKKKCNGIYKLFFVNHPSEIRSRRPIEDDYKIYGYLCGMSASQITYAIQASSDVSVTISRDPFVKCKAKMLSCNYNTTSENLYIGFDHKTAGVFACVYPYRLPISIDDVQTEFEVKHSYFDTLNFAVSNISDEALRRIIPQATDFRKGLDLSYSNISETKYPQQELDENQFHGLRTMLFSQSSPPVLIPGPFGCGKTRLISVAAECIIAECKVKNTNGHVLVCCYQQDSADIFMNDYFIAMAEDKRNPWNVELVRVTSSKRKINHSVEMYYTTILDFKKTFQTFYSRQRYLVVVTTYSTASNMSKVVPNNFFTHILIDEGAQTREPENLGPLLLANSYTRIVIAGDVQQVGPKLVVLGDEPQMHGLGESLLQRLHKKYTEFGSTAQKHAVSLTCNYRCHKDLLELPSVLFYEASLVPCGYIDYHPLSPYPFKFVCSNFDISTPCSPKRQRECDLILEEVKKHSGWSNDICIMAPSLNQANLIRNTIYQSPKFLKSVDVRYLDVRTSYQMQGQEYDLLFMSTIESLEPSGRPFDVLKSLCHPAVFNTAITRSRSLVVAVGNPLMLMLAEATMDEPKWCWREFIHRCLHNRTFVIPSFLERKYLQIEEIMRNIRKCKNCSEIRTLFNEVMSSSSVQLKSTPNYGKTSLKNIEVTATPTEEWPDLLASSQIKKQPQQCQTLRTNKDISKSPKQQTSTSQCKMEASTRETKPPVMQKKLELAKPDTTCSSVASSQRSSIAKQDEKSSNAKKGKAKGRSKRRKQNSVFTHTMSQTTPAAVIKIPPAPNQLPNSLSSASNYKRPKEPEVEPEQRNQLTFGDMLPRTLLEERKQIKRYLSNEATTEDDRKNRPFTHEHLPYNEELLEAPLSRQNYKEKFHQLLCREEDEHDKILQEKCNGRYTLTVFQTGFVPVSFKEKENKEHTRYGVITGDKLNGDIISYVKQASADNNRDNVNIHMAGIVINAEVVWCYPPKSFGAHGLMIGFTTKENSKLVKRQSEFHGVSVSFVLKWSYFDRLHKAIDKLPYYVIERIVPQSCDEFTLREEKVCRISNPSKYLADIVGLDEHSQLPALKTIMGCKSSKAPVLVVGSFGTGKTRLLARAAYEILQNNKQNRVLICAHHQASADSFIKNHFAKMKWNCQIIRLIPTGFYRPPDDMPSHVYQWYKTVRSMNPTKPSLVVTTFSTSLHLLNNVQKGYMYFTHILLDEGAQSREPESIAPLCLANKNTKIVIAGDHMQVGPALLVLGDIAIKHGLSLSLLERLHSLYSSEEFSEASKTHCATLLTNFRCHHALLSLPSYLFYDSTLVTAAEAVTHLHPKAKYPLHFICSSLSSDYKIDDASNDHEAELLLRQVSKYVKDWPEQEWGEKYLSKICVMTATADQKSQMLKLLRTQYMSFREIVVLTAYDIQGQEFEAVFLSTFEPTTADGKSKNPTKSPCSQYVFNTALTRAKSLVVCAGNPFVLMKIEEHTRNKCSSSCWKDYIRRCILCKTFDVTSVRGNIEESIQKLQCDIFPATTSNDVPETGSAPLQKDTILKSLHQAVQKVSKYKHCKLQVEEVQNEARWDIVKDEEVKEEGNTKQTCIKVVQCELTVINQRCAEGRILTKSTKPIKINGYNNRRGAFDGDIVEVQVFGVDGDTEYGKVTKVIEDRHPTKYTCRADRYSIINFYPLDRTIPGIVNLPRISRRLIDTWMQDDENDKITNENYITVFVESSLPDVNADHLPQIKELIPYNMAHTLLFVVKVIGWSPKYRKPLGAVVEAMPRTSSLFYTERLLKFVHDIDDTEVNPESFPALSQDGEFTHYDQAFTIDPPDSINLDDALSLVRVKPSCFKLAVLIANVAKHIQEGGSLDQSAEKKGTSVYGGSTASHMLPSNFSENLSLNYNTTRDVLVVTAEVMLIGDEVAEIKCDVPETGPEKGRVTSRVRLTYRSAQLLLENKPVKDDKTMRQISEFNSCSNGINMTETLNILFKVAMKLRTERLGETAWCDIADEDDEDASQSHFLVQELMIWANSSIAKYLCNALPDLALVRRQLPPSSGDIQSFQSSFGKFLNYSMALKRYSQQNEGKPLIIPDSLLRELHASYNSGDHKRLLVMLSNDVLYPQLAQARSALHKISCPAEYIAAVIEQDGQNPDVSHHSLNLESYTHFTSPIRRYFDILVQRLVIATLDRSDIQPEYGECLRKLCHNLNHKNKMAKRFERAFDKAKITNECGTSLKKTEAFISTPFPPMLKENKYQLCLPASEFKHVFPSDTQFNYSHLNVSRYVNDTVAWHVTLCVLNGSCEDLFTDPRVNDFISTGNNEDTGDDSYCQINADTYHPIIDDEDTSDQGMKRVSHTASVSLNTHKVNLDMWKHVHQCLRSPVSENIETLMKALPKINEMPRPIAMSHQIAFSDSPIVVCDIVRSFRAGEVVNVWLGQSVKQPLPTPNVYLMEIAPTIAVCVQHNQCPALCFSDVQLEPASKSFYHSIEQYVELWNKVLVAEASYACVSETTNLVLLKNAILQWPKLLRVTNCIDDVYYSPIDKEIILKIPEDKKTFDFIKLKIGDMICARYFVHDASSGEDISAVYHFVITNKHKEESEASVQLAMKAISNNCRVSEKMKFFLGNNSHCELQVIAMPVSFNRVFKRLQKAKEIPITNQRSNHSSLGEHWSKLSVNIARGLKQLYTHKVNVEELEKDPFALVLWETQPSTPLNGTQKQAIILAMKNTFQLIQGPPGTGKSVVGAHLAYIFSKFKNGSTKCVLYCCPSNKAVDVVHKNLQFLNTLLPEKLRILRLYGKAHERKNFPDPTYDLSKQGGTQEIEGRCLAEFQEDALHYKIRKRCSQIEEMRQRFCHQLDVDKIIPSSLERKKYHDLIKREEKAELSENYDIILCTCNEACGQRILKLAKDSKIAQCIIDECGMANEPETITAASLCEHVVLIGDHKQLQPVIKYPQAKECGMERSLFERYADIAAELVEKDAETDMFITLDIQYRMHKNICTASSNLFYDGMLKTDSSVVKRKPLNGVIDKYWRPSGCRIKMYDVIEEKPSLRPYTGKSSIHSSRNESEAHKVMEVINELHTKYGTQYKSIAVLTPYTAQKELLKDMIKDDAKFKDEKPVVATIIESQGDEYDIVILSTVRSLPMSEIKNRKFVQPDRKWMLDNLGFIIDKHQINVGITRAKHGLIIIGNLTLLKYDDTWFSLIIKEYTKKH